MSKSPRGRRPSSSAHDAGTTSPRPQAQGPQHPTDLPPLKPRRLLVLVLGLLLALWIAGMLVLYFTTVYPHRHEAPQTPTSRAIEPKAPF